MNLTEEQLRLIIRRELAEAIPKMIPVANSEESRKIRILQSQLELAKDSAKRFSKWFKSHELKLISRDIGTIIKRLDGI